MRTRELIAGALLLPLALIHITANPVREIDLASESCPNPEFDSRRGPEIRRPVAIPEPSSALLRKDRVLAAAYYDTMKILSSGNRCSAFFGGPEISVGIFSNFMAGVRKDYLPPPVGLKMSGDYVNVTNAETKAKYRLFDKASLNSEGPFYRRVKSLSGPSIMDVGSFPPNSRQARVLMLLHELGHLIRGSDGQWLLPDDGGSTIESFANTRRIESICGDQIRGLSKQDMSLDLARQNNSGQTVSPAAATSSQQ